MFTAANALLSISALLACLTLVVASPNPPYQPPLIVWHGLGDTFDSEGLQSVAKLAAEVHPSTYVHVIRLGEDASADRTATFYGDLNVQVQQVCDDLSQHPNISSAPVVNALGFSQGGVFLRGLAERCGPRIANLVTFGSPHNGIVDVRPCKSGDWLCEGAIALFRSNVWAGWVQGRVVPAQYYRNFDDETGKPSSEYLDRSNFLADINNERDTKNKGYARNLAGLRRFIMYMFEDDTVIIPKQSAWFAEVNRATGDVTPLVERDIYRDDWLGLKAVDQRGGIVFRTVPGEHMHLSDDILEPAFKEYFGPINLRSAEADTVAFHDWEL
ncbi:palmitoyl-protein thioesterase 1 precursor [Eremomyces bilateralis CBS 781.70]|uniref:Palmitoyl-protein thioesterase 1 n=1 Tax=Eremomyces bilateralis CBS 781.70 TaxID=1392243 RepID=A0A6G1FQW3_9PEZI|nr:palmitoyl-protein thioesterase 1 precursor [Eremomyces bilateralis CBS 781.70]KAF1808177.1 palmitoyl-protein thioesterase 1 precursor [Eremomyces bilateralis CBS 781.70]